MASQPEHDCSLALRTAGNVPDERLVVPLDGEHLVDVEQVRLEEVIDLAVTVSAQQHHVVGGVTLGLREGVQAPGRPRARLPTHVVGQLAAGHLSGSQRRFEQVALVDGADAACPHPHLQPFRR
jgi:hypothetical protein